MKPTHYRILRSLLLGGLLLVCFYPLKAQNIHIIQYANEYYCGERASFSLEIDSTVLWTEWIITPPNNVWSHMDPDSIAVLFYEPGIYTIIANSFFTLNYYISDTLIIEVLEQSNVIEISGCFEISQDSGCYQVCAFSKSVVYFDQGTGIEITGAQDYSFLNPYSVEITWGAAGNGKVLLNNWCDVSQCFEILPHPDTEFKTVPMTVNDTLTVCTNEEIYFENASVNGLEYLWLFGDGSQLITYNAIHSFSAEGFYSVTLKTKSICECSSEKQIVVKVLPAAIRELDCVNTVCPETRQKYTTTINDCSQFNWTISSNGTLINGGGPNDNFIEIIWHDGPVGYIELTSSDCLTEYCPSPTIFQIPIITPNGPIEGDGIVCSGETVTYHVPYFKGTEYHWQVGPYGLVIDDQRTNSVTVHWDYVNSVATSFVSVEYNNCFLECEGSATLPVVITPEISLIGDDQVCQNGEASISAEAGFIIPVPADVQWHIENSLGEIIFTYAGESPDFTHTFNYPPGEYAWVATNLSSAYCNDKIRRKIIVTATPPSPAGIKGEHEICPGQEYGYTIEASGQYTTFWTITDGASITESIGQSAAHIFGSTPPYIVQAAHGDIQYPDCISSPVTLVLSPSDELAIEGPSDVCFNGINQYYTSYFSGVEYIWEVIPQDHGEIKRTDLNSVEVFWTQTGPVTLRLTACGSVFEKTMDVHPLPGFNLVGPVTVCANEVVSISTDQALMSHIWSDDENDIMGISNSISLSHGSYSVTVKDIFGCTNSKPFEITSYPVPSVYISTGFPNVYCNTIPPGIIIVANTDGTDYQFTWFKDDFNIGAGGAILSVNDFGAYHAEVINQYGCKSISGKINFINCCLPDDCTSLPACFMPGCAYIPQDFDIVTSGMDCQSRQYTPIWPDIIPDESRWSIFSLSLGTLAVVEADILTYDYTTPGYYFITMTGLVNGFTYLPGICGHFQELRDTIRAIADFGYQGMCAGETITFEDLTTFLPDESIGAWSWDFDDPGSGVDNTSSLQDPTHIFSDAGNYKVRLITTLLSGCTVTKVKTIQISSRPILAPTYDQVYCEKEALGFHLPGDVFEISWDFGDISSGIQNIAESDSVFHTYELPGLYTTTVSAIDVFGCRNQVSIGVDIRDNTLSGSIGIDPSAFICSGDTVYLSAPAGGAAWTWSTGETEDQISVTESNLYSLVIHDQYHCTFSPPPVFVTVSPKPEVIIKAREIYGPDQFGSWDTSLQICQGIEFEIQAFSSGINSYQWGNGLSGPILTFTDESGNLPAPGDYEFSIVALDNFSGCISDSSFIDIEIFALPVKPLISLSSGSGCSHSDNELLVTNPEPGIIYQWSDGQTGVSIITETAGNYFVLAMNPNGCTNKSSSRTIKPAAPVDQIPGGCHVKCDPLSLCLPTIHNVTSWNIYQNGVLYSSGTSWPSNYFITADGSYTIEVMTSNGCAAISSPLDISLYTGVGSVTVLTYLDVDHDGMITATDMLLPDIPVQIISADGLHAGFTNTSPDGAFVFKDFPATTYTASFNPLLLSSQWKIVIDSVKGDISTCGDSVVFSLLLAENCVVTGADLFFESCPGDAVVLGDSIWNDTGQYTVHLESISGCDSVFEVHILWPGMLEIGTTVWVDVDQNGIVSSQDTVIGGITIVIDEMINHAPYIEVTDINGSIHVAYPSRPYLISIDSTLLPSGLSVVYGVEFISDTVCGVVSINFLLVTDCADVYMIRQEEICDGDSVLIESQWISNAGIYSFLLSQPGSGCDTTLDVYVTKLPEPILASIIGWDCIHLGSIELTVEGNPAFQFDWSPSVQGDSIVTGLTDGLYTVTISDANGCTVSDTYSILSPAPLSFEVPAEYEVHVGDSVHIIMTGDIGVNGLNFSWSPSGFISCDTCEHTWAFPDSNSVLTVQIMDADSCIYRLETNIVVRYDSTVFDQIYVPNVFSPNGDDLNDRFTFISRLPDVYLYELTLMDRWGELVFHISDIPLDAFEGWDGIFKDKPLHPQVFVYFAKVRLSDGREVKLVGDVTLVR